MLLCFFAAFLYSSSHSVAEVNRASYQGCNTTNVLLSSSNGNTTFALTKPGDRYFICGNRLHCYAGMKLHVVVDGKAAEGPAAGAPEPVPVPEPEPEVGGETTPTSKNNNPSSTVPNSAMFVHNVGFMTSSFVTFAYILSWIF